MVKQWFLTTFYPDNFLSCYGLRHSYSFHFIFILLLIFHKVLPAGKSDPAKCLQSQIGWLKSTENEWESTGRGARNWNHAIPNKKEANSLPHRQQGIQTQLKKLSEDIQEIKSEIKKFHDLAFRHKFSASFLLELEKTFSCIICRSIPARKPLIACSGCNSLIGCQKCVNEWYGGIQGLQQKCPKCRCERGLTKTVVIKDFEKILHQIRNLKDSTTSDDSDSGGAQSDHTPKC